MPTTTRKLPASAILPGMTIRLDDGTEVRVRGRARVKGTHRSKARSLRFDNAWLYLEGRHTLELPASQRVEVVDG